jgi:twinfilin-like protein
VCSSLHCRCSEARDLPRWTHARTRSLPISFSAVDEKCQADFASASSDASTLCLKYQIKGESFTRVAQGTTKDSLEANWKEIARALSETPNDPAFIAAKHVASEKGKWLLIFFMPEGCTVRDRMVYAASASALKDGLGQGNFDAATFSVTHLKEVTSSDFEAVSRSMSQDDLLTLDEKAKLEGENESAKAMSSTRARAIVGLPIKANEDALDALNNLHAKGTPNTVILSLNADTEILQVQQSGTFTFEQVQSKLPANEPRYIVQSFSHEHEGAQSSAIVFVYYCPEDAKSKLKMFYSTSKQVVVKICETIGMQITKSIELSETKELNTPAVLEELYPQVSAKKTFKKPARPGRGNARLISPTGSESASSPSPK